MQEEGLVHLSCELLQCLQRGGGPRLHFAPVLFTLNQEQHVFCFANTPVCGVETTR